MANQMLVDATHPEETRVVVVRGNRVEEFDFESANRKQLRGNIYLAKVTRVEPSLQAAFVDYGGNRHGFLAFSEIHPDYYQIPVADRQALLEEEKGHDDDDHKDNDADEDSQAASSDTDEIGERLDEHGDGDDDKDEETNVEHVGAEDALEEVPERRSRRRARQYKIQEVIKRRQILLVQVVKEERGNKGAALTTYLSLAGRYSVLMPNTARGGGISRKITNVSDRKRLKQIASELEVADGMGVILRTAGASRTKSEIKRDFEYLLRLWENVRDLTLQSAAPLLVYEEGSLIKRSIRDLYNKDIDQVLVSGDEGYKEAKGFMRMLMPSHARNVQPYREPQPIFNRFGIEHQLDAMFSPQVTLKSGGYIVIDQTEALVSIDVNSGRSTREHNIEDTALSTNLEAAEEISRQLRLRDLAGLVVIDFIDMEEKRNNRAVEKRLKDCLKSDRARIQVGRISHFGLMEMSRQRIRTGVLESSMDPCPHCHGTGHVRAAASVALLVLRTIEDHLLKGISHNIVVKTRANVALYILNQKRANLGELETRFNIHIKIDVDDNLEGKHLEIERGDPLDKPVAPAQTISMLTDDDLMDADDEEAEREEMAQDEESSSKKRRRRRRRKKSPNSEYANGNNEQGDDEQGETQTESDDEDEAEASEAKGDETSDDKPRRSRRRGRRGGRRNRRNRSGDQNGDEDAQASADDDADTAIVISPGHALIEIKTGEHAQVSEDQENKESTQPVVSEGDAPAGANDQGEQTATDTLHTATDGVDAPVEAASEQNGEHGEQETPAEPVAEADGNADADADAEEAQESAAAVSSEEEAKASTEPVDAEIQQAVTEPSEPVANAEPAEAEPDASEGADSAPEVDAQQPDEPQDEAESQSVEAEAEQAQDEASAPEADASDTSADQNAEEGPARPKRSGWWNRNGFL